MEQKWNRNRGGEFSVPILFRFCSEGDRNGNFELKLLFQHRNRNEQK